MNKKISTNYILNLIYQILSLFIPLIVTPYISRVIGVDGIGQYSFSYSIVRYFCIFTSLGITTFGVREIGKYRDKQYEKSKCFHEIMIIKLCLAIPIIILYLIVTICFFENKELYLIETFYIFASMVSITWFYQGIEKYVGLTIKNTIIKILSVVLIFVLVKSSADLWIYVLILSLSMSLSDFIMWFSVRKEVIKVAIKELQPFSKYNVSQIILLFIPTLSVQIFSIIDKSLIGWITNSDYQNGIYEQGYKIINMGATVITSLSLVKVPLMARKIADGDLFEVKRTMHSSFRFVWFLGIPIALGLVAISPLFVPIFFGDGYEEVITILCIFSPLVVIGGLHQAIGCQYIIPANKQNKYSACLLLGGLFNVIFSIITIQLWGAKGAALSSILGELIICILCVFIIVKDKLISLKELVIMSVKYIVAGIVMFLSIYLMMSSIMINNYVKLILCIVSGVIIYFLSLLILKERIICSILNKVLLKFRKNKI